MKKHTDFFTYNSAKSITQKRRIRKIFGALAFILIISGCDANLTDAEYVDRAKTRLAKHESPRAIVIDLKNALRDNPNNAEARWLLGQLYLDLEQGALAEKELKRAAELKMSEKALAFSFAKAKFYQGKTDQFLLLAVPGFLDPQDKLEWHMLRAQEFISNKMLNEANAELEKMRLIEANSQYTNLVEALLEFNKNDLESAELHARSAINRAPLFAKAYTLLGDISQTRGDLKTAISEYDKAIEIRPWADSDRLKRAMAFYQLGAYNLAENDVRLLEKHAPNYPRILMLRGLLNVHNKNLDEAENSLRKANQLDPNDPLITLYFGEVLGEKKQFEQAQQLFERLVSTYPNWYPAQQSLITMFIKRGAFDKAFKYVLAVGDKQDKNLAFIYLRALTLSGLGNKEASLADFEQLVSLKPDVAFYQLGLTLNLISLGRFHEAQIAADRLSEIDPNGRQEVELVMIKSMLNRGDKDEAMRLAERWQKQAPNNALALLTVGNLKLMDGDVNSARTYFDSAASTASGNTDTSDSNPQMEEIKALNALGQLDLREGDLSSARENYLKILAKSPDNIEAMVSMATISARSGSIQDAKKWLEKAISIAPVKKSLKPRVLLASIYLTENKIDNALSILREAEKENADKPLFQLSLGRSLLAAGRWSEAVEQFKKLAAKFPQNPSVLGDLARAYVGSGDLKKAEEILSSLVQSHPDYVPGIITLSRLFASTHRVSDARTLIKKFPEKLQENPNVILTKAFVEEKAGDMSAAATLYSKYFEIEPSRSAAFAVSRTKFESGDYLSGLQVVQEWVLKHPDDIVARRELANIFIKMKKDDQAEKELTILINPPYEDAIAMNNIAFLLKDKDAAKALKFAQKAYDKIPDNIAVIDTLAIVSARAGDTKRGVRLYELAMSKNNFPEIKIRYINALIEDKQTIKANESIRALREELSKLSGERVNSLLNELDNLEKKMKNN